MPCRLINSYRRFERPYCQSKDCSTLLNYAPINAAKHPSSLNLQERRCENLTFNRQIQGPVRRAAMGQSGPHKPTRMYFLAAILQTFDTKFH